MGCSFNMVILVRRAKGNCFGFVLRGCTKRCKKHHVYDSSSQP